MILLFQCEWCLKLHKSADLAGKCERECQAKADAYHKARAENCNGECIDSVELACRKHETEAPK